MKDGIKKRPLRKSDSDFPGEPGKYKSLFDTMEEGVAINELIFDKNQNVVDYRIIEINPAFLRNSPFTAEQVIGRNATDFYNMSSDYITGWWKEASQNDQPRQTEYFHEPSGRWFRVKATAPVNNLFATVFTDITEHKNSEDTLKRLNRELHAVSLCNQALLRAVDEQTLLDEICRIVCEEAGYRMAWVGYAENDKEKTVRPVAWAGNESGYIASAKISWSDETDRGRGPTGTAIRNAEIIYFQDYSADPQFDPWRESALQRGYRSSIALPLKDINNKVFGALNIYSSESYAITPEEKRLLKEFSEDLAFGISVQRIRKSHQDAEEALEKTASELVEAQRVGKLGSWDWDARTDKIIWSDEYYRIYGFDATLPPPGYEEHLNAYTPESAARLDSAVKESMSTGKPYEVDLEHIRSDGTRGWVTARCEIKKNDKGEIVGLRGTAQDITERKAAEERLKQLTLRNELILDSAGEGIYGTDMHGNILFMNKAALEMLGYTLGEITNKNSHSLFHHSRPDGSAYPMRECPLHRTLERGECTTSVDEVFWTSDNRMFPIEHIISPLLDHEVVVGAVIVFRDITERKIIDQERISNIRFYECLDQINQIIQGTFEIEQMMREVLKVVLNIFGSDRSWLFFPCDPESPTFRVPMEVTRPEYPGAGTTNEDIPLPPDMAENLRECLASPVPLTYSIDSERPVNKVSAEQFGVKSMIMTALRPKLGKPWAFGLHQCSAGRKWTSEEKRLFQEISGRLTDALTSLLLNAEIKERELRYREIFENASDIISISEVTHDGRFRILEINPSWQRLAGMNRSEMAGKFMDEINNEAFRDYLRLFEHCIKSGKQNAYEHSITTLTGTWDLHTVVIPISDSSGNIYRIIGFSRDITERKRAEEEVRILNQELEQRVLDRTEKLEAANKELEAFAYSVSHDLRAPLRHIEGFMDLFRQKNEEVLDEPSKEYLNDITEASRHMSHLIEDLLSFSRMGQHEMQLREVNLNEIIDKVIQQLHQDTREREIVWNISRLPVVSGDGSMLQIVVTNLISNALKFTRPLKTARLDIGCRAESSENIFYVRDNGVGFDPEYSDKLFGVFKRLHRADEFEGTGIGLANVRRIIERHGGRTWAEGEVGKGATFYFSLPVLK